MQKKKKLVRNPLLDFDRPTRFFLASLIIFLTHASMYYPIRVIGLINFAA